MLQKKRRHFSIYLQIRNVRSDRENTGWVRRTKACCKYGNIIHPSIRRHCVYFATYFSMSENVDKKEMIRHLDGRIGTVVSARKQQRYNCLCLQPNPQDDKEPSTHDTCDTPLTFIFCTLSVESATENREVTSVRPTILSS